MMDYRWLRPTALLLAALIGLAGCAGGGSPMDMFGSDEDLTPAQQGLREESERFQWTRVQGALVGAAGGALAGWLISKDATGAVVGAAAGGALGYAAGYYIDSVNQSYADQQQALNTRIDAANQDIARYERAAVDARTVVANHRQQIADLNAQYARQEITADQYSAQVASIEGDIDALQNLINESSGNVELMDKDIANLRAQGANVGGLVARRNQLASQRDALQAQLDTLASAIGSIPDAVEAPLVS
jgi:DNA repair exonuclease SbcCD ATPase subunit